LKIFAIVPVKRLENGKSRLATFLSSTERIKLCELLLKDTLSTLKKTSRISEVIVVSSDVQAEKIAKRYDAKF
jgi:2-phospho-L-lactate guanylyltransferase (CobY/MobA/RfbA family)